MVIITVVNIQVGRKDNVLAVTLHLFTVSQGGSALLPRTVGPRRGKCRHSTHVVQRRAQEIREGGEWAALTWHPCPRGGQAWLCLCLHPGVAEGTLHQLAMGITPLRYKWPQALGAQLHVSLCLQGPADLGWSRFPGALSACVSLSQADSPAQGGLQFMSLQQLPL